MASDNFAHATGYATFTNYSHASSGALTDTQVKALVDGGVANAIVRAQAFFFNDPAYAELFTESSGSGIDGEFQGKAKSETQVMASFSVGAEQSFSFDFLADIEVDAKEIENPDAEYNKAKSKIGFLLLDISDVNNPEVLDYFGIRGRLISSEGIGRLKHGSSDDVTYNLPDSTINVDGDDGTDSITATAIGTYERTFDRDTHLALVAIDKSVTKFAGDTLIGNLGEDYIYGTIWGDDLDGTKGADKIYGSLGKDILRGRKGDDRLEGGQGNDKLNGGKGNDVLIGGHDNDRLVGGHGYDTLTGNSGVDGFFFKTSAAFTPADVGVDTITDFEVNTDKIVLSKTTFTALTSTVGESIDSNEFEAVANDDAAATSNAFITYSLGTGNLFYNQNGADSGLGTGAQFATLQGIPTLRDADFTIFTG